MEIDPLNWPALEQLRTLFLAGTAGQGDYWRDEQLLASYDATFAQRIGWKWDHVLEELAGRGWTPPTGEVLDWGCGSGIAGRALLDQFGAAEVTALRVSDRSPAAVRFAAWRAREKYPGLVVHTGEAAAPAVLLLSHVLTELDVPALDRVVELAHTAACVIWVEPGTHEASRALSAVRERLRGEFNVIAPCTHQFACGMLASGNERHWCHHFARPPGHIFHDGNWSRFGRMMEIDLRSLPVSYLVLDRRPAPELPAGAVRVIGRPRLQKAEARVFVCDEHGVKDRKLPKRSDPDSFQRVKKDQLGSLQVCRLNGENIARLEPI